MKNSRQQKPQGMSRPQKQHDSAMNHIRAQYLSAGVTSQELAEIEYVLSTGDTRRFALMIALIKERLEEQRKVGHPVVK